jgi:hypothetical protein
MNRVHTYLTTKEALGNLNHVLNIGHAYGSTTDTMKVVKIMKKGKKLEKHLIHEMTLHMNDAYIDVYSPIFKALQDITTRTTHRYGVKNINK